jgi:uncharacterized protein YjbI with pentapeptide repeats
MFTLLGVALFCLLTVLGSSDHKLLLTTDSTIKVPVADAPLSFVGFIVVAPFLLLVLTIYLHIFFGYWLDCEGERQYLNQRLIPPIESTPTIFSFPDPVSRFLTGVIFYWLIPSVLWVVTWKAWADRTMGLSLTYVSGFVTCILMFLQIRRRPNNQRTWWTYLCYAIMVLAIGRMGLAAFSPKSFQRPLNFVSAELPKASFVRKDLSRADAHFANLQGANFWRAILTHADLTDANLRRAILAGADLTDANLAGADLTDATLTGAVLTGVTLTGATLTGADLTGTYLAGAILMSVTLRGASLRGADLRSVTLRDINLTDATLTGADLTRADLTGATLTGATLTGANLTGANLTGADLETVTALTQDQVDKACGNETSRLPTALTKPAPCPIAASRSLAPP